MKSKQLFCFTYAGGNATFFNDIENDLPDIDVIKLEYAGHGSRHREPYYADFDELSSDMFSTIKKVYSGGQYALFGYSMGAISLVESLRRIVDESSMPTPSHVFIAAHEPHTKSELANFSSGELDELVKKRTINFGGVPKVLIDNKAFWRTYLPVYRADYSLIGRYKFEELDISSNISATFFYSEEDTPLQEMLKWKNYFVGESEFHSFSGTHFFINEHHKEMSEIIHSKFDGENL